MIAWYYTVFEITEITAPTDIIAIHFNTIVAKYNTSQITKRKYNYNTFISIGKKRKETSNTLTDVALDSTTEDVRYVVKLSNTSEGERHMSYIR